jgi:hypothetical protein
MGNGIEESLIVWFAIAYRALPTFIDVGRRRATTARRSEVRGEMMLLLCCVCGCL